MTDLPPPELRQFTQPQNPFPPETQKAYAEDRAKRGLSEEVRMTDSPEYWERMAKKEQPNWTKSSSPSLMGGDTGPGLGGFRQQFPQYQYQTPQAAQRGTVDQNMNNPAFKQQQDAYNMTDYQRLMQRKDRAANAPPASFGPPMSGMMGLGGMPVRAPSDYEIANSLGYGDLGITDMRRKTPEEYQQQETTRQARAKSYLDSIGYGQAGFDPSKYEVKREVQPSGSFGSLFGKGFG